MENIYKTPWGMHLDLSKIVAIELMYTYTQNNLIASGIKIHCQLMDNPIRWDSRRAEPHSNILINAWKEYNKSIISKN